MSETLQTALLVYIAALLTAHVLGFTTLALVIVAVGLFGGLVAGLSYYGEQPTKSTN
ncbi:hypothetical protein [Haloprofundus halophilus]|uniref:hypothetical protein n=1 Tax=Haloprofundus halophilus TaxID=2283527 RepID=UPI001300B461|nr:hypothetical protein [Haloprofundus halophilus]